MILLLAVLAGLAAGLLRAALPGRSLQIPSLRWLWLAPVAFFPQFLAFHWPATRGKISDPLAAAALVGSQLLLLVFAWVNRRQPGFWLLGLGLALNLSVITLNGGWMPVSPENAARLFPGAAPAALQAGERLGMQKDLILPAASTRLAWLSDRFLSPAWIPYRVVFSLGDLFVAAGAFRLLWTLGEKTSPLIVFPPGD